MRLAIIYKSSFKTIIVNVIECPMYSLGQVSFIKAIYAVSAKNICTRKFFIKRALFVEKKY